MNFNQILWDQFYKTKKILKYPDENLIRIIETLKLPKESSFLDYGCGTGRHIKYFLDKGFFNLYGVDISQEAIEICQQLYPNVSFYTFTNLPLPFSNHFFDVVICWGVLHYIERKTRMALLEEFHRVLKNKSYLVGTYRAKEDSHFVYSEIKNAKLYTFDSMDIQKELSNFFTNIQLGYALRTPLNHLEKKIAHYFFICQSL